MDITLKHIECRAEDHSLRFLSLNTGRTVTFMEDYRMIFSFFLSREDWNKIVKKEWLLQWLWGNAKVFKEEHHNFFSLKISMHEPDFDTFTEMIDPQHVHLGRS